MFNIEYTKQFRKDIKDFNDDKKALKEIKEILESLSKGEQLSEKYRDHALHGNWKGNRECHVKT